VAAAEAATDGEVVGQGRAAAGLATVLRSMEWAAAAEAARSLYLGGEIAVDPAEVHKEGCATKRREVHRPSLPFTGRDPLIRFVRLDEGVPPAPLAYRDQELAATPSATEIVLT
jgi:hypothetical protein